MRTYSSLTYGISALALAAACNASAEPASPPRTTPAKSTTMSDSLPDSKRIIRRLYEVINAGSLEQLDEVVSPDFVGNRGERGPAGFRTTVAGLRAGFPDI